ncbi:MAG: hypothetical protein AB8G11_14390 [Saprospiraceae bacterium]
MKKITIIFAFLFSGLAMTDVAAQVGAGLVFGGDYYQWYRNPTVAGETDQQSSGNAILNGAFGPKIWFGAKNFSLSLEGHINWAITAFDMHEYKGMGHLSFPLLAKLNFGALSTFDGGTSRGFYIGGGVQYSRTEAYGLTGDFDDNTTRNYFQTLIGEIGFGGGEDGVVTTTFVRFGVGENNALTLNIGSMLNFNVGEFIRSLDLGGEDDNEQIQSFM